MRLKILTVACFFWIIFLTNIVNAEASNDVGQKIYDHFCITCHQDGVANAPKLGDNAEWQRRLASRTFEDLVTSAMQGLNAMPAQGTCMECNKEDIKAAIQYMLPKL